MRRSRARLLVCTVAATASAGGAWAQDSPAAPTPPQAAAGPGVRWHVPLALSGSVGYELRADHTESERARVNQLLTATVQAASYIYQPWMAVVNGQLGLTLSRGRGGGQDGVDRDQFVTGGLRLGVFPRSRFPFEMRYEVSDSRIDPALSGALDYRSRTFGMIQRYRPPAGEFTVSASYERRSQDGDDIGEDTQEQLLADFSSRWRRQAFNASLSRSLNRRRATSEESDVRAVVLRHAAGAGDELSVETNANWNETDDRLQSGSQAQRVAQWSSVAMWRPANRPYNVSASVRGLTFSGTGLDSSESISAAVAANYEVTPQLRAFASASAQHNNPGSVESWAGSLGASYQGDTRTWRDWTHVWFASATVSRSHQEGISEDTLGGQLGQAISRLWGPVDGSTWSLSLNQSASGSHVRGKVSLLPGDEPTSRALSHSLGLGWNHIDASGNAAARLTLSDARQFDGNRSRLQLLNLQVTGTHEIDRMRSWTGSLTVQRVFQRARTGDVLAPTPTDPAVDLFEFDRQITHTASGELSYQHMQFWGVPRLRFSSVLRLSGDAQHQRKVLVPLPDRETASWENRLDWRVGRLDASAALRAIETDGVWRSSFVIRVLRSFGQ